MISALEFAKDVTEAEVTIYSDSAFIVNQVLGNWKAKDSRMEGYCMTARDLLNAARKVGKVVYLILVPRSQNKAADALVNRILDSAANGNPNKCPKCGNGPERWTVENHSLMWHDGDIYCECGQFIRKYDAG